MATQSETGTQSTVQTVEIKKFIDAFNAELEVLYSNATKSLGPWSKNREDAIKITKLRKGTWPDDPSIKTIGDLFGYVFYDTTGVKYKTPPTYLMNNGLSVIQDEALFQQWGDWIDDMNGVSVSDPSIGVIFKSLSWPYPNSNNWTGDKKNSTRPITLSPSAKIIENYDRIKKAGITNPDRYSAGQYWFDLFMSQVVGLNGFSGYLKGSRAEDIFSSRLLDNVGTMSVSKFSPDGETTPYTIMPYLYDRYNYASYTEFDEILNQIGGGGYDGFDIGKFDSLKTQYRPGVNSIEELSKDPLFYPGRMENEYNWKYAGTTQSGETGIYWIPDPGMTQSVGSFEYISLYKAFIEAGDNYQTVTLPKEAPVPAVVPTTEEAPIPQTGIDADFTFNVEKKDTFVVVGNQNFTLKIGDLVIEGLTSSTTTEPVETPKTIDLGDGIVIIDDEESGELDPYSENPYSGMEESDMISIQLSEARLNWTETTTNNINVNDSTEAIVGGSPIKDIGLAKKVVILMKAFMAAGYTKEQSAGIVGNLKAESALRHFNVEDGASNIRPGGMGSDRWDAKKAIGSNYAGRNFSGIGLCQWTYGARYQMEKFVGKFLTDKGVTTSNLKNGFFDTDPGLFSSNTNQVYGGAADLLEKHLSSVPYLFEAQVAFAVEYWIVTGKPCVAKNLKGNLSGNTSTICKNGIFLNQTGGKPNTSTVAGACEIFLCDGEVPGPVGTAVNGKGKDKYRETVNERVKCSNDVLATYNSNSNLA